MNEPKLDKLAADVQRLISDHLAVRADLDALTAKVLGELDIQRTRDEQWTKRGHDIENQLRSITEMIEDGKHH